MIAKTIWSLKLVETICIVIALFTLYQVYLHRYFSGTKFKAIRDSIARHTDDCNELNDHIEELKSSYSDFKALDYGDSQLSDTSAYNMRRRTWQQAGSTTRVHNCSGQVCKNANNQPFKYLCKYFDIKTNENTLARFEGVMNNFSAAEQGKFLLRNERDRLVESVDSSIPKLVSTFSKKRLVNELGFHPIDLSDLYFPVYTFQYISAGGNSSARCDIKLDIGNLDRFIIYMSELVKFQKSVAGQRALMTSTLRERIKQRDDYTCMYCGLCANREKNLLLEIDHIIPLSKGGITSEANLQTLCWKCNRSKGSKIISDSALQQHT